MYAPPSAPAAALLEAMYWAKPEYDGGPAVASGGAVSTTMETPRLLVMLTERRSGPVLVAQPISGGSWPPRLVTVTAGTAGQVVAGARPAPNADRYCRSRRRVPCQSHVQGIHQLRCRTRAVTVRVAGS